MARSADSGDPRRRAPRLEGALRREQLARVARDVIGVEGLRAVSVKAVAERAGIVASGVYKHFRGKDDLIDSALGFIGDRLIGNVAAVCRESDDALDCLRGLVVRHGELIRSGMGIPRVAFSDEVWLGRPDRKQRMYGFVKRYLDAVAEIVRRGQGAGQVRRDVDADTASVLFLGIVQPAGVLWHLSDGGFDLDAHLGGAWELFASFLAPTSKKRPSRRGKGDAR